jgi:hypothetical protein
MKVIILGVDHAIQWQDYEGRLEANIRNLCSQNHFSLIAEEWSTCRYRDVETVAKKVANRSIPWANVEMDDKRMEELRILDCIRRRRPQVDDINGVVVREIPDTTYLPEADRQREEYWIAQIESRVSEGTVLMVCGMIHALPLAGRMKAAGFEVTVTTLCEHAWYRGMPITTCAEVEMKRQLDGC